jgi:hypothetical protein
MQMTDIGYPSHQRPSGKLQTFLQRIEDHAAELRRRAGVGPTARLDPRALTTELQIHIVSLDDIHGLSAQDRAHLATVDAKVWSGAGMPLPDGHTLVILHPNQTLERATATIMEEVCHAYFGHTPSQLITLPGGIAKREYHPEAEREAYWTAAAALLPAQVVAKAVWRGAARELAADYGVSIDLVEFRVKTLRLWQEYQRSDIA